MSFDDEWAALVDKAAQAPPSTRLNGVPEENSSHGELSVTQKGMIRAAGYIEDTLGPDTKKAANIADAGSAAVTDGVGAFGTTAAGGLKGGWQTKKGLRHCVEEWERQATGLVNRLAAEITALREADHIYTDNEEFTASQFKGPEIEGQSPHSKIHDYI